MGVTQYLERVSQIWRSLHRDRGIQILQMRIAGVGAVASFAGGNREVLDSRIEKRHQAGGQDEAREAAKEIRERLLGNVERIVVVAREAKGKPGDAVAITPIDRCEGVGISRVDCGDEIGVGSRIIRRQMRSR